MTGPPLDRARAVFHCARAEIPLAVARNLNRKFSVIAAQRAVERLDCVSRIDDFADLWRAVEEGRQLIPSLSACFGRRNKKRTDQITGILATLKALGHIV